MLCTIEIAYIKVCVLNTVWTVHRTEVFQNGEEARYIIQRGHCHVHRLGHVQRMSPKRLAAVHLILRQISKLGK